MQYIKKEFFNTFEEKKSKFIAHIVPYDNFDELMKKLKEKHPKARHFVYAYRYLNEFDQIVENSSDDGEPRGTSGKPSLAVLSGAGIINSAVIIVRYFGGTKLGTGGLVRAYSDSVNAVLEFVEMFEYKKLIIKKVSCKYSDLSKVEYILKQESIHIKEKEFLGDITLILELTKQEWERVMETLPNSVTFK